MPQDRTQFLQRLGVGSLFAPAILKNMEQQSFNAAGDFNIVASKSSSPNDFEFLVGPWNIHNRKLKTRLNNCREWTEFEAFGKCRKILNGFGNIDDFRTEFNGKAFEGMALRLFNPNTKLWSIYWTDSNVVVLDVPQVGSFDDNIGNYVGSRVSHRERGPDVNPPGAYQSPIRKGFG
jgi:hypothetical protein